jgi:hypothetical protein
VLTLDATRGPVKVAAEIVQHWKACGG